MIEAPQVVRTDSRTAAVIHFTIPRDEMREIMDPAITELMDVIGDQELESAGPVFAHHQRMDPEIFDFELGVPVAEPVAAAGRVRPGRLPATTVARTVYHGTYEGLPAAWGEFDAWVEDNGYTPGPELWECYVVHPDSDPDPDNWRTELNRPLIGDS